MRGDWYRGAFPVAALWFCVEAGLVKSAEMNKCTVGIYSLER